VGCEVTLSLRGVLERLSETRGLPETITIDNGPGFTGKALDEWAYRHGVKLNFIRPGKPVDNAYAESFNGKLRDELLNREIFATLKEAEVLIKHWWKEYNEIRPNSRLGYCPPASEARIGLTLT
jgi:putative transposase